MWLDTKLYSSRLNPWRHARRRSRAQRLALQSGPCVRCADHDVQALIQIVGSSGAGGGEVSPFDKCAGCGREIVTKRPSGSYAAEPMSRRRLSTGKSVGATASECTVLTRLARSTRSAARSTGGRSIEFEPVGRFACPSEADRMSARMRDCVGRGLTKSRRISTESESMSLIAYMLDVIFEAFGLSPVIQNGVGIHQAR